MLLKIANKILKLLEKREENRKQIIALIEKLEQLCTSTEDQLAKAKEVLNQAKIKLLK